MAIPETRGDTAGSSSPRSALLFPGQGSQDNAMRELAGEHCPELIAQAAAALGDDPFERKDEGTSYLQPAVYCGTLACWRAAGEPLADFAAGHSLGELAALTVAGYVTQSEGMRLVLARAIAMQRAADRCEPGGLVAMMGPRERTLELAELHRLSLAADNEPKQLVLSGPVARLKAVRKDARACGIKAARLPVPAALHSSAMSSAVGPFRQALETATLATPRMRVIANATAQPFTDVVSELALGMVSCVRWRESIERLQGEGVRSYREMGTSDILSGLVERTLATA